ncbi:MAG: bifunctional riboflavin kinase/FMN adenylyltransferase [Phycisphaerales bacterium JB040]
MGASSQSEPGGVAVCVGNFDGVHAGHASLLRRARECVGADGRVVVLSFDPHPAGVLRPGEEPERLTAFGRREALLHALGADEVVRLEPSARLLGMTARDFVSWVVERYEPGVFVEGPDFRFGKGRAGDVDLLRELGARHAFGVEVVEPVAVALRDQSVVRASSSIARWLLAHGRVRDAAVVLGRMHAVEGTVVAGDRRGRTIGFPTANIEPETMAPGPGVYGAIATELASGEGRCWAAAVNVGTRPTFEGRGVRVEAHLIDEDRSYAGDESPGAWAPVPGLPEYGWPVRLELVTRVRDEARFGSVDGLVGQLRRDVASVRDRVGPVGPRRASVVETA